MKCIGFDARYINDRYHGIGRYAFRLLEAILQCDRKRNFVIFRGRGADSRFNWDILEKNDNVQFRDGPWPLYWPSEQAVWPKLLKKNNVDLYHSPYFVAPLMWDAFARDKKPVITTVHDLIFDRYPAYMPHAQTRPYYRFLMSRSTQRSQAVINVSGATTRDLRQYYPVDPGKVVVIPEGTDPLFSAVTNPAAQEDFLKRYLLERPFILSVGARRPHKNLARLVHAFAKIHPAFPHQLVFAGPPDERFPDEALQTARSLDLNGSVHFLDWIPEVDLPILYSLADVVVLPSLIEGFGLPALEAMASGIPVIASGNTSFPEVLGDSGVLFDPNDVDQLASAISGLLADPVRRQRSAEAGRIRASQFTWDRAAAEVIALYDRMLL